ncbi:MAG TPA: superoxide dismutase [Methanoregulaceae archaeon]|nr:superoxide dismutase [Methanoregulaceae archaeon]HPD75909.1 superoxide dismutase [Methanoregulaceae archaeon]HRY75072.1 superoxide dismutase [Methanoregulaceae archaeon]
MAGKLYSLPKLPYDYAALEPYISEQQLTLHHTKHHLAYVNGANALIEKYGKARKDGVDMDMKAASKELSFHVGGFNLHNKFWENMAPAGKGGGGVPKGELAKVIDAEYGSFDRFRKEFTQAASSTEGSGWAALSYCRTAERPVILQIEKHNVNVVPGWKMLLVLDVWEHAYYLDYKNDRGKFIEGFWNIVNWNVVADRLSAWLKK